MKLSFLLCFAALMQVSAHTNAQIISLNKENVSLKEVLNDIHHQTGYSIFYDAKMLRNARPVNLHITNVSLKEALDQCFQDQPFSYVIRENTIVVTPKEQPAPAPPAKVTAITGRVTDNKGQPLQGVNVTAKNSKITSVTDKDGNYNIKVNDEKGVLIFSFIGYSTREISIDSRNQVDVVLEEHLSSLNEVVVTGYNSQRKMDLTGSVVRLQAKDIENNMVSDPLQSIQGKMPGLEITQGSGQPGSENMTMLIRGPNSFATNNAPLVLVNGVVGNISDLDPSSIENITVLKDASSAAIYGARAANGVILVTTKTGTGDFKVELNTSYINQSHINWPKRVWNSVDYMTMLNTAIDNAGGGGNKYPDSIINLYKTPTDQYPSFNWEDYMIRPINIWNNTVSIGGKSGNTNYYATMGIWNQNGIVRGFDFQKYTGSFGMESQVSKRFRFGISLNGVSSSQKQPANGAWDEILSTLAQTPTYKPYLLDGSGHYTWRSWALEWPQKTPIGFANEGGQWTDRFAINGTAYARFMIIDGLTWEIKGGMSNDQASIKLQNPSIPIYNYITNGFEGYANAQGSIQLTQENDISKYYTVYSTLNYVKTLFGDFNVNALLGVSKEKSTSTGLWGYRYGFASPTLDVLSAGPADGQQNGASVTEYALQSFFGRLNINYKHKYLFEADFRRDGSSRFPPSYKYAVFPSFSAGWHLDQENFAKNWKWMSEMKLRVSYGELGNDNVNGNYPYQATLTTGANYPFSTLQGGVGLNNLPNDQLKWEQTTIKNLGLDFNINKNTLYGSVDYFIKNTSGILRRQQIPGYSGVGSPFVNEGEVENKGFEILVGNKTQIKQVSFGAEFNISFYKNRLVKFGAPEYGGTTMMKEGYEINRYFMYQSDGIYQSQDEIDKGPATPWVESPGDVRIKDVNGDGKINSDDRVDIGGALANYYYGLNLFAHWKNFDISVFFQGEQGKKVLVNDQFNSVLPISEAPLEWWKDSWTPENHSTTKPKMDYYYGPLGGSTRATSTFWLMDASYARLKNVVISYTLPASLTRRISLTRVKVFVSGQNLATFTKFPFGDPETGGNLTYPMMRSISGGLNVQF